MKVDDGIKDRKFIVFESQLMTLFHRCHSCGLEVKLETSIVGILLVVNGICPDGHVLHWQSQPMVRGMAAGKSKYSCTETPKTSIKSNLGANKELNAFNKTW